MMLRCIADAKNFCLGVFSQKSTFNHAINSFNFLSVIIEGEAEETLDDSRVNFGEDKVNFKEASEEDSEETREARKIDGEVTPYSGEVTGDKQDVEPKQAEEIQGRFFLKDKLCALGLTDVRI